MEVDNNAKIEYEYRLTKDLRLKNGTVFLAGLSVLIGPSASDHCCYLKVGLGEPYLVRYVSIFDQPSIEELHECLFEGIGYTPIGNQTENDGVDEFGFPSWMRILGIV